MDFCFSRSSYCRGFFFSSEAPAWSLLAQLRAGEGAPLYIYRVMAHSMNKSQDVTGRVTPLGSYKPVREHGSSRPSPHNPNSCQGHLSPYPQGWEES